MRVARRGCGDEIGRERLGGGREGVEGRAVARRGGVGGGQAREQVVQDFEDLGRGAGAGVDHDGQVGAGEDGGGAEGWGEGDGWGPSAVERNGGLRAEERTETYRLRATVPLGEKRLWC